MGLLVVMGSGETAPTMVKLHRQVFDRAGGGPAFVLDSPFGFQENADELTARTIGYLRDATGRTVTAVQWRRPDPQAASRAVSALRGARWVLAGPGSPTYALRVWADSGLADEIADLVRGAGVAVFSSAAALTLGSRTVPVYEVYKSGEEPRWREGLDVFGRLLGLKVAVVPHFDNREGGTHDTRYCYLGAGRMAMLEADLGPGEHVLGVDEHTALLLDFDAGTATVWGNGVVTVRRHGHEERFPADTTIALTDLVTLLQSHPGDDAPAPAPLAGPAPDASPPEPALLRAAVAADLAMTEALSRQDAAAAGDAVLALEDTLEQWAADPSDTDDRDRARRTLRTLVVRLADLAARGVVDPSATVGPYVDLLLAERARARADKDYARSDRVRDGLAALGVTVQDTPDGQQWSGPA